MFFQSKRCSVQNTVLILQCLYSSTQCNFTPRRLFGNITRVRMTPRPEAYLRVKNDASKFHLSFTYHVSELNLNKEIHFTRDLSEPVSTFLNRLSMKVGAASVKKQRKKKAKNDEVELGAVPATFMLNDQPVSDEIICKDLFENDATKVQLKVGNQSYSLVKNLPWVDTITLPKSIMVGYPVYMQKFHSHFTNQEESEFSWYRVVPKGTIALASGQMYVPTFEDIGHKLKLVCVPRKDGVSGFPAEVIAPHAVEAGPGYCPFEMRHSFTSNKLEGDKFRVVSYNILADIYASSETGKNELFCYCPSYALTLDYRKQLLIKEIMGYNADIISLQEVDCRMFDVDLKRMLRLVDLKGVFAKKGGQVGEGVACYYRTTRFKLLSSYQLILGEESSTEPCLQHIWNIIRKNSTLHANLMERTTTVQFLVLEDLHKPKRKIVVANTHLYFHPKADHIRILQAALCLHYLNNLVTNLKSQDPSGKVAVVFNGDFNSTPECGVYKLFTENHIPENYHEWKCENGEEEVIGMAIDNPIKFDSACGTPEYTNYTPTFYGCLDYIFFESDNLKVDQVIPFPLKEDVTKNIAIPSVVFPSDHIALVADLSWKL